MCLRILGKGSESNILWLILKNKKPWTKILLTKTSILFAPELSEDQDIYVLYVNTGFSRPYFLTYLLAVLETSKYLEHY